MEKVSLNQNNKTIIENVIRELLNESTSFSNLSNEFCLIDSGDYLVLFNYKEDKIYGVVSLIEEDDFWYVGAIASEKGYGYNLTKMAMTKIYPKALMTDRDSSTTDGFMNILAKLRKEGLSDGVLDPRSDFYVRFKNKDEDYNALLNTMFKFNDSNTYNKLIKIGDLLISKKPYILDDMNDRAFKFFSEKLNGL